MRVIYEPRIAGYGCPDRACPNPDRWTLLYAATAATEWRSHEVSVALQPRDFRGAAVRQESR